MKLECGRCYKVDNEECVLLGISKYVTYFESSLEYTFNNSNVYTSTVVQTDNEIKNTFNEYFLNYMFFMPVDKLGEQYLSSNVVIDFKKIIPLDKKLDLTGYFMRNKMLDKDFDNFFEDEIIQAWYKKYYEIIKKNRDTIDLNEYFQRFYGETTETAVANFYFDAATLKYYVRADSSFYFLAKAKSSNIKDILRARYIAEKKDLGNNFWFHTKPVQVDEKDLYALFYNIGEV